MIPTNNSAFLRGAWAITKPGMCALLESIKMAHQGMSMDDFFVTRRSMEIDDNGIAHIDIKGSLLDNVAPIHEMIGSTDYRTLRNEIAEAQDAKAIMFNIDSPGGTVAGLEEASEAIASSAIPTVAYCDGMSCSAAYHLSASADNIVASPSADVGNIGTVLSWYDDSAFMESIGYSQEVMTNEGADLKGTFRDTPMTDSQREFLQEETNRIGEEFQQHVIAHRPNINSEVFRAGWYHGTRAGELGLVDAIGSKEGAYAMLVNAVGLKSE
jgi:ClpP class serine protease